MKTTRGPREKLSRITLALQRRALRTRALAILIFRQGEVAQVGARAINIRIGFVRGNYDVVYSGKPFLYTNIQAWVCIYIYMYTERYIYIYICMQIELNH